MTTSRAVKATLTSSSVARAGVNAAVGCPQLFDVQIHRPGDVRLEIARVVVSHVDDGDVGIALSEERGELAAGGQARRLHQRGPHEQWRHGSSPIISFSTSR